MNPKDFIEIAKRFKDSSKEAEIRTSINRAYYGVLNLIKEFFKTNNIPVEEGPGVHGDICNYLHYCSIKDLEILSNKFDSMKTIRNRADYNMKTKEFQNKTKSQKIYCNALEIIGKFESSNKHILISGVKNYLKKISQN